MNYEYLSLESAEDLHKSKKAQADNKKLKTDNELYKHLYEIELKRNKELQERIDKATEGTEILFKFEDYHILSMETYCVIKNEKHIIKTVVDYVKNQRHCRKIFKNILQGEDTNVKDNI